jgi:hypothetical protein
VLVALLIVILGLTPSPFSLWMMRRAEAQAQERLRLALESIANRRFSALRLAGDQHYVEGVGYMIGDLTCQFNARSSYLRCAVNPSGPCETCRHYQGRQY